MKDGIIAGFIAACAVTGALCADVSCKGAETAIIQGVDQACTVLDSQPEPSWVYFTCSALDAAGTVLETYTVKVPKTSSETFKMKYVKAVGDGGAK
jgi:hypothetical protein